MATKQIAWTTGSGNITLTYEGQGDGTIVVGSDPNNLGDERSQTITIETTAGSPAVVKNFTISQDACPFPVGDVRNFAYTGNVQSVLLPAGQYKLQCWGAQGGSNAAASSYGITAKAGGKGGYSEGILTLTSPTTVYIFIGGKGSSSGNGGWNGGGGGSGSSSYSSGDTYGVSRMGCGGGATDIALVTSGMSYSSYRNNRSSASLLSRMIVAGGGSGGAGCCKAVTTSTTTWTTVTDINQRSQWTYSTAKITDFYCSHVSSTLGKRIRTKVTCNDPSLTYLQFQYNTSSGDVVNVQLQNGAYTYVDIPSSGTTWFVWQIQANGASSYIPYSSIQVVCDYETQSSSTSYSYDSQVGYAGGGTTGGGYSSTYQGKQNTAGSGGSFGQGANQTTTNYRYCSGAGGGGWYGGGGGQCSDSSMTYCKYSGGGSGFVNTAANAQYRPSGYTGLQLDSGETKAGNTSFPNTAGTGNETGHSGNGYAKITRIS